MEHWLKTVGNRIIRMKNIENSLHLFGSGHNTAVVSTAHDEPNSQW
jgi:hypothetical protein